MKKNCNVKKFAIALIAFISFAGIGESAVIADSESEFSHTQGQDGWFYGYYGTTFTPSHFQQMTLFSDNRWFLDFTAPAPIYWTNIGALSMHPNGNVTSSGRTPEEQWSVRRYVSEFNGTIQLVGIIEDINSGAGDGVVGRVFHNDTEVLTEVINDGASSSYDFSLAVSTGDIIDFALDPRNSDIRDSTNFTATITAIPEPSCLLFLGLASMAVVMRRRRPA